MKRKNQTYCFFCDASDTVLSLKKKIQNVLSQHPPDGKQEDDAIQMQLIHPDGPTVLDDEDKLVEYEIKDNSVLHVAFEVADNEFETVEIQSTDLQDN